MSSLWVWPGTAHPRALQARPCPSMPGGGVAAGWGVGTQGTQTGRGFLRLTHWAQPVHVSARAEDPPLTKWRPEPDTQAAGEMPQATH